MQGAELPESVLAVHKYTQWDMWGPKSAQFFEYTKIYISDAADPESDFSFIERYAVTYTTSRRPQRSWDLCEIFKKI